MTRVPRPHRSLTGLAAGLLLVLSACAGSRYEYVRDPGVGVAYRVPADWAVFDKATVIGAPEAPGDETPDPIEWLTAFDADPTPSPLHVFNPERLNSDHPWGLAAVYRLDGQTRDRFSIGAMRNLMFPLDGLAQGLDDLAVYQYDDAVVLRGGEITGIEMDYAFRTSALPEAQQRLLQQSGDASTGFRVPTGAGTVPLSQDFVRFRQGVFTDAANGHAYVMLVGCSVDCAKRNESAIRTTFDSWRRALDSWKGTG